MESTVLASSTAKIAESTLKVAFGAWAEKSAAKLVEDAIAESPNELLWTIVPSVAKEAVGATAAAIAGPLLKILLRLTDATSAKLDKIVRQPYQTGMHEAGRALIPEPGSVSDQNWREHRLKLADSQLAIAFTLADGTKTEELTKLYISFVRALMALAANANRFARMEFETAQTYAGRRLSAIDAEIEAISQQFRQWTPHVTDGREYPGASGLYSQRTVLRARRADLLEFGEFVESCLRNLV